LLRLAVALPQNLEVVDFPHNGSGPPHVSSEEGQAPRPVPELVADGGPGDFVAPAIPSSAPVTDEDRNRFGVLLDRAVERGLLPPAEYEVRLRELAEATSVEEMTEIVSALPAFTAAPAPAKRPGPDNAPDLLVFPTLPSPPERKPPWVLLLVVVVTLAVALVVLALFAAHTVHTHTSGGQSAPVTLSAPRL
jgi:DUF1707 SHOCT-like domain